MNPYLATILLQLVKAITSGDLVDHITGLVRSVADLSMTGDEKRALVKSKLATVTGDLAVTLQGLAGNVVNLAIEAAVTYVRTHKQA